MHKQTKHNKRIKRKNKTLKHYGGDSVVPKLEVPEVPLGTVGPVVPVGPSIEDNNSKLTKKANEVVKELAKKNFNYTGSRI